MRRTWNRQTKLALGLCTAVLMSVLLCGVPSLWAEDSTEPRFSEADRNYWAFETLARPATPQVSAGHWVRTPIDAFILNRLEERGIVPAREADRRTLIRRAYFDLWGLPPSPEAVAEFVNDPAADAFAKIVDELLISPRYGERWGRHWLDLVRYSDSNGFKTDEYRSRIWRYRDYVIRSFNEDKPYDRFVREQLAGDELDPNDPDAMIATGYLRLWPFESNQRDLDRQWSDILDDITDITGEVFLGMGFNCAKCHDHKFDPILRKDYYRLRAFFAALYPDEGLTAATARQRGVHARKSDAWREATKEIRDKLETIEAPAKKKAARGSYSKFEENYRKMLDQPDEKLTSYERQIKDLAFRHLLKEHGKMEKQIKGDLKIEWTSLRAELASFSHLKARSLTEIMGVRDIAAEAPTTMIPGLPNEPIEPGYLSLLHPASAKIVKVPGSSDSTGRRLTLANWITDPENPLATRVIANRIWQHHFGRGLVANANDFGRQGEPPTHPKLLDWLARRFVADGWSFKEMHRLIMNSAVYRQASLRTAPAAAESADPDNRLLWRMPTRRLDAEQIRDAMLCVSGECDLTMGGKGVEGIVPRRSVYLRFMRNTPDPFLDVFDFPDGFNSAARRKVTTTATQALLMMNDEWTIKRGQALARRIESEGHGSPESKIDRAYQLAFGRVPAADESREASSYLERSSARMVREAKNVSLETADHRALSDLCHALMNSNEFLYVD